MVLAFNHRIKCIAEICLAILQFDTIFSCDSSYPDSLINETSSILLFQSYVPHMASYAKSIMEFLLCKKNLLIKLEFPAEKAAMTFEPSMLSQGYRGVHLIPIQHVYGIEMVSAVKVITNDKYFSFIRLFDSYVWIALLISVSTSGLIYYCLLTNQSAYDLTLLRVLSKVRPLLTRSSLVLLTFVWLQSASVVTKAFTGLLLETYFNVRSETLIDSLKDLHQKTDIQVAAHEYLIKMIGQLDGVHEQMIKDFSKRTNDYIIENKFDYNADALKGKLLGQMVKGETVIIGNSVICHKLLELSPIYAQYLAESDQKYMYDLANLYVYKHLKYSMLMKFLLEQVQQAGLRYHHERVSKIISSYAAATEDDLDSIGFYNYQNRQILLDGFYRNSIICWLIGYVLSLVIFILEKIFSIIKHSFNY